MAVIHAGLLSRAWQGRKRGVADKLAALFRASGHSSAVLMTASDFMTGLLLSKLGAAD
jgi:hypothetical protein